jgi:hypothetical protein
LKRTRQTQFDEWRERQLVELTTTKRPLSRDLCLQGLRKLARCSEAFYRNRVERLGLEGANRHRKPGCYDGLVEIGSEDICMNQYCGCHGVSCAAIAVGKRRITGETGMLRAAAAKCFKDVWREFEAGKLARPDHLSAQPYLHDLVTMIATSWGKPLIDANCGQPTPADLELLCDQMPRSLRRTRGAAAPEAPREGGAAGTGVAAAHGGPRRGAVNGTRCVEGLARLREGMARVRAQYGNAFNLHDPLPRRQRSTAAAGGAGALSRGR